MRTTVFLFLSLLLSGAEVRAQDSHDRLPYSSYPYVQGPMYKVINRKGGPAIEWDDEPIDERQVVRLGDTLIKVFYPDLESQRLAIYLWPDGTLRDVVDLYYQQNPWGRRRKDTAPATAPEEFSWDDEVSITFRNGLKFSYDGLKATAYYLGKPVAVSGKRGRYRIETADFEAGIAFGPNYGKKVYQYLREK